MEWKLDARAGKSGLIGPFKMSTESTKAALFETRYRNALTAYVQQEMEDALMDALELGRKALAEGQGLLDLIAIHHTLLASLIEQSSNGADIQRRVARARDFLTQATAPFEMHRGWHEMASERVQAARELERLNRELQKRAAELEASNKELESFAYSVSHDLRAPLRHVAAYTELLQEQASSSLDDKSRRYVQTILESAKRMGNLIGRSAGVLKTRAS